MIIAEEEQTLIFKQGIAHPDYFLWDAWSCQHRGLLHLYCLALPRRTEKGEAINPDQRNQYRFHVRHFISQDDGISWKDHGVFQQPAMANDRHDSSNVWSGSVFVDAQDQLWVGYTGIEQPSSDRPFVQNMALAKAHSFDSLEPARRFFLSSVLANYNEIRAAGYFLDAPQRLGYVKGECGGSILAWRDPFLFASGGKNYMAFAAKASAVQPAMGLARWDPSQPDKGIELLPPVVFPDDHSFTQLEVPKIYALKERRQFLLLCATTDRISEDQPGDEVNMQIRLYLSEHISGPWRPAGTTTSVLGNCDHLFGATVLTINEQSGTITLMAPYTTAPNDHRDLTFAPRFSVSLEEMGRVAQVHAVR